MANFNERLIEALNIRRIKQVDLCKKTGIGKSAMSQYMSGKFVPKQTRLYILSKALNVSIPWLMGADVPMEDNTETIPLPSDNIFMCPVFETVAAGFNKIAQAPPIEYFPTYISAPSEKDKYMWLLVRGDSMSPLIDDGSRVLVKMQDSVDSGQIAVVLIDGDEGSVKRVNYGKGWIELLSVNPYYPPRRFEGADVLRVRVVGLVKDVLKTLQ